MKLELYFFHQCPFCQVVLRQISQLGMESKIELKNILENAEDKQFHLEKTGRTTVPCLYIDGEPLFESHDINNWLLQNNDKL